MNKSVLGFLAGVCIIAIGVIGWVLMSQEEGSTDSPRAVTPVQAPAPKPVVQREAPAPATGNNQRPAPTPTPTPATPSGPTDLSMTRSVGGDGVYTPGGTVDLTITLDGAGADPVRALGLSENAPAGFEFDSMIGDNRPDVGPQPGATGTLEFAWIQVPPFPLSFTYRLRATDGVSGTQEVRGQALYRTTGAEQRTGAVVSTLQPGEGVAATPAPAVAAAADAAAAAANEAVAGNAMPAGVVANVTGTVTPATPAENTATASPAAAAEEKQEEPKKAASDNAVVELSRAVSTNTYVPGEPIEVTLTMNYEGDPILALAVLEEIPNGWSYGGFVDGAKPAVEPQGGPRDRLTFIWINVPDMPASLTYKLVPAENESGPRTLNGYAVYRTTGPEVQGPPAITEFVSE